MAIRRSQSKKTISCVYHSLHSFCGTAIKQFHMMCGIDPTSHDAKCWFPPEAVHGLRLCASLISQRSMGSPD